MSSKIKKLTKDIPHYIPLLGILGFGVFGFLFFFYDKVFQTGIAFSVSLSYVVWGVVHHKIHKDLYFETFIEYVVIAVLGFLAVLSVIFRS